MGKQILFDVRLFAGAVDLSGNGNKIEIDDSMEVKTSTNWRSGGARQVIAGLEEVGIKAEGQWEAADPAAAPHRPDDAFWLSRRVIEPVTAAAAADSDLNSGGLMYLTQAVRKQYSMLGDVGEVIPWGAEWEGSWPMARGVCAHPSGVPRTALGNGNGFQIGAPAEGQAVYATLHVLSVAGTAAPTLTVTVKSSVDGTFAAPTVRATFNPATAKGGQAIKIAGPITDSWWKVTWTVSGTAPSFLFLAAIGIA